MKNLFYCLLLCAILTNCTTKKESEAKRVSDISYSIITDSIFSSMPGSIFAMGENIYWQDARETEGFIHVVNTQSGKEICCFGNIGDGPDEFVMPIPSISSSNGFFLNDIEKGIEHLYRVDETGSFQVKKTKYEKNSEITGIVHLSDETIVCLTPGTENLFQIMTNKKMDIGGKFPLMEKYKNAYYLYQGQLAYNADKNLVVYNCMSIPYIATYLWNNGKLTLGNEILGKMESRVQDGNFILDKQAKRGAMDLALTQKNIVTLDRDVVVEGEKPESKSPLDPSILPHSLFVYDYDLTLTHIVNTKFPILRICGDTKTNSIYAIVLDPDYTLIKIDLSSL